MTSASAQLSGTGVGQSMADDTGNTGRHSDEKLAAYDSAAECGSHPELSVITAYGLLAWIGITGESPAAATLPQVPLNTYLSAPAVSEELIVLIANLTGG